VIGPSGDPVIAADRQMNPSSDHLIDKTVRLI